MRWCQQRDVSRIGTNASRDRVERTQEVNDEAGHAEELLLALATMIVSWVSSCHGSPLEAGGRRRATYSTSLVGVPTLADILLVVFWGGIGWSGESVDGDDGWKG